MTEEKEKKDLQVYFPELNADLNVKELAVKTLDYYIKKIEKDLAETL